MLELGKFKDSSAAWELKSQSPASLGILPALIRNIVPTLLVRAQKTKYTDGTPLAVNYSGTHLQSFVTVHGVGDGWKCELGS